jgi:hypothetical protein
MLISVVKRLKLGSKFYSKFASKSRHFISFEDGALAIAYDGTAWNTVGEFPIVVDNHSAVVIGGDSGAVYVFGGWGTTNAIDSSFLTLGSCFC